MIQKIVQGQKEMLAKNNEIVSQLKNLLKTADVALFKNEEKNQDFLTAFFYGDFMDKTPLKLDELTYLYRQTLSDVSFMKSLKPFMLNVALRDTGLVFQHIQDEVKEELEAENSDIKKRSIVSRARTLFNYIDHEIVSAIEEVKTFIISPENNQRISNYKNRTMQDTMTFIGQLNDEVRKINGEDLNESCGKKKPIDEETLTDPITGETYSDIEFSPDLDDDYYDTLKDLKSRQDSELNEGVADAANAAKVKIEKFEKMIDDFVNTNIEKLKAKRKNEVQESVVKESLQVSKNLKRLFFIVPVWMLNPGIAVLTTVVTLFIDNKADKRYRTELINDIKTEMKIVDEKLNSSPSPKEKADLIRLRDKLERERYRIDKIHV